MVIDFAIDGQHLFLVGRIEGLSAALGVDDAQSLMGEDGTPAAVYTTPIWTAVADFLTHLQGLLTQFCCLFLDV